MGAASPLSFASRQNRGMRKSLAATAFVTCIAGCATPAPPVALTPAVPDAQAAPAPAAPVASATGLAHFSCEQGLAFDAKFGDGSVELLFASRGAQVLQRDAGGTTPQQTVYSSTDAKVEFGLGAEGRQAKLNLVSPPVETRCVRE